MLEIETRKVLAGELERDDIIIGILSRKPQWVVRSVTFHEDETLGRVVNIDKVWLQDPEQLDLTQAQAYRPLELPVDIGVEILA